MESLAQADLLLLYLVYLGLSVVLTVVLRTRYYLALLGVFVDFRSRFPHLYRIMMGNVRLYLAWPHVVSVAVAAAVFTTHFVLLRAVFAKAQVTPSDLALWWPGLVVVAATGTLVLALDVHHLFFTSRPSPPKLRLYLMLAEAALAQSGPVGHVSEGVINRVLRRRIVRSTLLVNPWFWWWVVRVGARVLFGTALWGVWAATVR